MSSFYGEINNKYKTVWIFDKYYPNKKAMDEGCENDGVMIGRFILITYGDKLADNLNYTTNLSIDNNETEPYSVNYDKTVWQKLREGNDIGYKLVGELNADMPSFKSYPMAPSTDKGPAIQQIGNSEEYNFFCPTRWDIDETIDFKYGANGFDKTIPTENISNEASAGFSIESSGETYYDYEETGAIENLDDTVKLHLDLSKVGHIAAEVYDLIYGTGRITTTPAGVDTDIYGKLLNPDNNNKGIIYQAYLPIKQVKDSHIEYFSTDIDSETLKRKGLIPQALDTFNENGEQAIETFNTNGETAIENFEDTAQNAYDKYFKEEEEKGSVVRALENFENDTQEGLTNLSNAITTANTTSENLTNEYTKIVNSTNTHLNNLEGIQEQTLNEIKNQVSNEINMVNNLINIDNVEKDSLLTITTNTEETKQFSSLSVNTPDDNEDKGYLDELSSDTGVENIENNNIQVSITSGKINFQHKSQVFQVESEITDKTDNVFILNIPRIDESGHIIGVKKEKYTFPIILLNSSPSSNTTIELSSDVSSELPKYNIDLNNKELNISSSSVKFKIKNLSSLKYNDDKTMSQIVEGLQARITTLETTVAKLINYHPEINEPQ